MKVNYNVDEYGVLKIYKDNYLLVELSECKNMSEEEINNLIQDYLEDIVGFDKERELKRLYE